MDPRRYPSVRCAALAVTLTTTACSLWTNDASKSSTAQTPALAPRIAELTRQSATADTQPEEKLEIEDLKQGEGPAVQRGKTLTVHYRAFLADGALVDDSRKKGRPFVFILGEDHVIGAWEKGLIGMQAGGERKIVAPPSEAYGNRGISGLIPPDASLRFEIELLKLE